MRTVLCLKTFLIIKKISCNYINLEDNPDAIKKVMKLNNRKQTVPMIIFDDGSILTERSNKELLSKLRELTIIE